MIRAINALVEKGVNNLKVRIAGRFVDAAYLSSLKQMTIEYNLTSIIEFIGFQKDMDAVWNQTDIAVICSRFESFGLSVCEAMARGIPAVCAKSTGTYEITEKGLLAPLYDIGDYNQLVDQLNYIISNYEPSAVRAAEVATIIQNRYDVFQSNKELVKLFQQIIDSGGAEWDS